jgi:hypothetical protein
MKALLLDERRCAHTFLECRVGIPNQIKLLLDELFKNQEVSGLFRHRASVSQIESLRHSLEEERGVPTNTSIHTIAQCFLQWCYELPEPLLGSELYSPIQSCQEIENEQDRYRNLSLLLDAVPWWSQPLLYRVMELLYALTRPDVIASNGLNIIAVSIFATPFLLRSPQLGTISGRGMTMEEIDRVHMIAVASGSVMTQILIEQQPTIFQLMGRYQQELQTALVLKCDRLRELQTESVQYLITHPGAVVAAHSRAGPGSELSAEEMVGGHQRGGSGRGGEGEDEHEADYGIDDLFDCSDLTIAREREIYSAMYGLWEDLRTTHSRLNQYHQRNTSSSSPCSSPPSSPSESLSHLDDVIDERDDSAKPSGVNQKELLEWENSVPATTTRLLKLMKSKRWEVCFPVENALHEFNSQPGGMLAIKCLSLWLKRFGDKASLIICEFALRRKELCSLPMICVYLIQICLVSLKLVTPVSLTQVMTASKHHSPPLIIEHTKLRAIAREDCWSLLSDETALEQLFSISLLTFDDLWKHMGPTALAHPGTATLSASSPRTSPALVAQPLSSSSGWFRFSGSGSGSNKAQQIELSKDLLAGCMTGCRVLLEELLYVNQVTTVEQLWKIWTEQRLVRQQLVVEAQLHRTKQEKLEKELQLKQSQQDAMNEEMERESQELLNKNKGGNQSPSSPSCKVTEYHAGDHTSVSESTAVAAAGGPTGTLPRLPTFMKEFVGVTSSIFGPREEMILSLEEMEVLEEHLPMSLQCCDWELKYSLARDGASLATLVRFGRGCRRTLLVIEDTHGCHFGAVVSDDPWAITGDKYYGSGTCRVFSFHNTSSPSAVGAAFKMYEATMKNYYFMLTSQEMIGLGGGGGGFALLLDGDLNHGTSSSHCETFDSPVLSTETAFVCARCNLFSIHRSDGSDDIEMRRGGGGARRGGGGEKDGKSLFQIEMME